MNLGNIMFKIKSLLTFIIISSLSFTNEDEIQTYEKDGEIYTINQYSKNITPLNKSENITTVDFEDNSGFTLSTWIGNISPIGENVRKTYNPGFSLGLSLETPKTFHFFKKDWNINANLYFTKLPVNSSPEYSDKSNFNLTTFSADLSTNFGPVILRFGLGFSPLSSSYHDEVTDQELRDYSTFPTLTIDVGYPIKITPPGNPNDDFNIIVNLHLQEVLGSPPQANGNRGTSELYGISLLFGKNINF